MVSSGAGLGSDNSKGQTVMGMRRLVWEFSPRRWCVIMCLEYVCGEGVVEHGVEHHTYLAQGDSMVVSPG